MCFSAATSRTIGRLWLVKSKINRWFWGRFRGSRLNVSGSCHFSAFPTCDPGHSSFFCPFGKKRPVTSVEQFVGSQSLGLKCTCLFNMKKTPFPASCLPPPQPPHSKPVSGPVQSRPFSSWEWKDKKVCGWIACMSSFFSTLLKKQNTGLKLPIFKCFPCKDDNEWRFLLAKP